MFLLELDVLLQVARDGQGLSRRHAATLLSEVIARRWKLRSRVAGQIVNLEEHPEVFAAKMQPRPDREALSSEVVKDDSGAQHLQR